MQILYAYSKSDKEYIDKFEKELKFSINKSYDLFDFLLLLILSVADHAAGIIEQNKNKRIPLSEDLNPNTRFINNRIIELIKSNKYVSDINLRHSSMWSRYPEIIRNVYNEIISSDFFAEYMKKQDSSIEDDKNVLIDIYSKIIADNDYLYQVLEEESIYWNDEEHFIINTIISTIKKVRENPDLNFYSIVRKNTEDELFATELLRGVIKNESFFLDVIQRFVQNWEVERITDMDIILMEMAICEFKYFPSIPVKVTINEYLDIAKDYSTVKSSMFINGILDKVVSNFREEGIIKKTGRGLIGE